MKYPHLRPQPFVLQGNQTGGSPSRGNNMEARMAALQDTLARLVVASTQPTPGATGSGTSTSIAIPQPPYNPFEYGATGQVINAVATRSKTRAPQAPIMLVDPQSKVQQGIQYKGPADGIGQSRLPMTLGLADVVATILQGTTSGNNTISKTDVVKSLALKVLEVPLFSGIQLQHPEFDPAAVYLTTSKIMQSKVHTPVHASTEAMHAEEGILSSLVVDEDGSRVQTANATEEALHH